MKCENCAHTLIAGQVKCPECGHERVSEVTDSMDDMVAAASVPNLAALYKQGKEAGLIKPIQAYGTGA